jgi:dienelactone hydrolase
MSPNDFFSVGKWFAELGFAVAIPMRRGYGHSFTSFAEGYGSCTNPDYVGAGRASAQDIEAVVGFMRRQPGVDPNRVVLIGHSAGGWGTLAAASENPAGLAAAIVFAPGRGSTSPGQVCGGDALAAAAGSFGAAVHVPSLWIYSENDHFFSPPLAHQIFDAFQGASRAPAEFLAEPACSEDGHMLVRRCPDLWHARPVGISDRSNDPKSTDGDVCDGPEKR